MSRAVLKFLIVSTAILLLPAIGLADPCLVVYPDVSVVYHYDPAEYYTVGPGDPLYDPLYDRGGLVLLEVGTDEIDLSVYQAPNLAGFVLDSDDQGYFTMEHDFNLIVDGFSDSPTTYVNVLIVFDQVYPGGCTPIITIDGNAPLYDPDLKWYYPIGDLVVSTPTGYGGTYSDTETFAFSWTGCQSLRIWAFSDADHNLERDGGECFSAFSHDLVVPVEERSWGSVKSLYR
jgi:hypothetical protein